jgi:hypothetical protein
MGRFQVIEHLSHFAVRDTETGQERPMGDGVDVLFDADGTPISPGTEGFCEAWAEALNADQAETLAAYFPELLNQENGAQESRPDQA